MSQTLDKKNACRGLRLAIEATEASGALAPSQLGARLRLGSAFAFALPGNVLDAIRKTQKLFDLVMDFNPRELDDPPIVETAFGDLPVEDDARCALLEKLAERPDDERSVNLRRAAVQLHDYFPCIFEAWDFRRRQVWQVLYDAEVDASEHLYRYLMANLAIIRRERDRYANGGNSVIADLWKAYSRVKKARATWDVDELKTTITVVDAVALLITLAAIKGSIDRNDFTIDDQARKRMAEASGMQKEAQRQMMEGVTGYLMALRKEAGSFPVLLVIDTTKEQKYPEDVRRAALTALAAAEEAIIKLCQTAVNTETVPPKRIGIIMHTVERIANGSRVSVWKLPFFLDRALNDMPPTDANIVRRMRRFCGEVESDNGIKNGIMTSGVDAAMMVAAAAGPIGASMAFMWAVVTLARSVHEYEQLQTLFEASIDPAVLLLADEDHDPASKMSVFFDLLGLWV